MTETNNEKIVRKIKGLLAIANDNKDDSEARSALLMAQKLMVKHKIEKAQIDQFNKENSSEVGMKSHTAVSPKKLKWYERDLAIVIAENFRVKVYYSVGYSGKRGIQFFGYDDDCQLAIEVYNLALHALIHYSKEYVKEFYIFKGRYMERTLELTNKVKDSYIKGFISGLNESFIVQADEINEEYGLTLLTPVEVEEQYDLMSKGFKKAKNYKRPNSFDSDSYEKGYEDGKQHESTPRTKIEVE